MKCNGTGKPVTEQVKRRDSEGNEIGRLGVCPECGRAVRMTESVNELGQVMIAFHHDTRNKSMTNGTLRTLRGE